LHGSRRTDTRPDVVHVLPHAHPLGGTERSVLDLLRSDLLAHLDQRVVFLRGGQLGPFPPESVLTFGADPRSNLSNAARAVMSARPRVLHGWLLRGNVFAATIGIALPEMALLTSERNLGHTLTSTKRRLERFVAAREDMCIVNSHAVATAAATRIPSRRYRIRIIRPGIAEPDRTLSPRDFSCVAVGRLERVKDHETLVRAWPLVLAQHPRATLAILGDGPERDRLGRLIADLGVNNAISLVGVQDPMPFLQGADVYVSTSRSEGFSRALIEAFAAGVPAVATAVGGVQELPDDAVRTIPVGDATATAQAIAALLDSRTVRARAAAAGRAVYSQSFTLECCHTAYRDLYSAWIR
jgi:glycosyltransferase involved in cell wall biosynthesis